MSGSSPRRAPQSPAKADANAKYLPPVPAAVRRAAQASEALVERVKAGEQVQGQAPDGREIPTMTLQPFSTNPGVTADVIEAPAPVSIPTTPPAPPQAEDWEQRFRSLEGRFNSQMPAITERARLAEAKVDMLQTRIRDLEGQLAARPSAPVPGAAPNEEDVKVWGEDFVAAARRQARAEIQGELDALNRQIKELGGTVKQTAEKTKEQELAERRQRTNLAIDRLMGGVDWNAINFSQEFKDWTAQPDVFSGEPRITSLQRAYDRGDATTVANIFKAYLSAHTAPRPSPDPGHTPEGAARVRLEDLAAPGGQPNGNGGAPEDQSWVTQKEIALHYTRVTQGYYRNNPAGQAAMEARIKSAVEGGRVK